MNDADSKKLEEVDDLQHYMEATSRLSAKVKEQDREIAELRKDLSWVQESQTFKDKKRAEKLEAELVDAKKIYSVHATEAEKQIDELQERRGKLIKVLDLLFALVKHETGLPDCAANGVVAWGMDEGIARAGEILEQVCVVLAEGKEQK